MSRIAAGPSKRSTLAGAAVGAAEGAADEQPATATTAAATRVLVVARHRLEQMRELHPRVGEAGRHVVAGHLVGLVATQDPAGDRLAVDLVGPVVEPPRARVAVHP